MYLRSSIAQKVLQILLFSSSSQYLTVSAMKNRIGGCNYPPGEGKRAKAILVLQRGKLRLREGNKVVQNQRVKWVTDLKATCGAENRTQVVKTKLAC